MSVLLITDETTSPDSRSVSTRRWSATAVALKAAGCRVTLATLRGHSLLNEIVGAEGIPTLPLDAGGYAGLPRAVLRVARHIRSDETDVVHGHEVVPALVAALACRLSPRTASVYFRSHTTSSPKHSFLSRVVGRITDATMGGSSAVGECARVLDRTPRRKIHVVPNGVLRPRSVADHEVEHLRAELGVGPDDKIVAVVSRLRSEKGIDVLLRAAALPGLSDAEVRFLVVGSGPEEGALRALAAHLRLQKVHFAGHQDDVAQWYAVADVVASPSHRDAAPLSVLEAMACGKPVVASRVGGLTEWVVEGETGLLVPPDDPEALADALGNLFADDDVRTRMGRAARERFEKNFAIERMGRDWAATYRALIGSS